ncbi:MAG TPA: glycosyltransferase family 4 protein [Candidatus Saccharimonadales bacterium]|nr:glycosyltransferase family 4 protein [Candidatus Saccharimonadales bacterium]
MKILMLGWELPPHNSGGLGTACYHLCKELSKNDVDIEFLLPYSAKHDINFMNITAVNPQGVLNITKSGNAYDSFKYLMADGSERWLNIYEQQQLYEESVSKIIEEKEFDIVHAHDWLTFKAALRVKAIKNCPIVLHVHSVESDRAGRPDGNPEVQEIESVALHMADQIIAVSNHTKRSIINDYGIPADKIEVIHNSIEPDLSAKLSEVNSYRYLNVMKSLGYKVIVNIGRLTIQKGLPNLLLAAQKVINQEPKSLFLIVGSGEQYAELIELAATLGIGPNVLFADFQRGKRWRDAFAIGDLFVLPSVSEPFGLTPLESIGYGTPVLISKQSGVSEVLMNCLKVDHWDIDEMTNKIVSVIRSPELQQELQQNSYNEYERMAWEPASHKIRNLYHQHLAKATV